MGKKYAKKGATMKEIDLEMEAHPKYPEYLEMLQQHELFAKKEKNQDEFIDSIKSHERVLKLLQYSMVSELKFLYLD
jgi:hypothetical protein